MNPKKILYRLAAAFLLLTLLVSGGYIVERNLSCRRGAADYKAAAETAGIPAQIKSSALPPSSELIDPYVSILSGIDLNALRAANQDVLGWILIPETTLSYPFLQGENNTYYLNHSWTGERNAMGAIFMECQCASDFSNFNTIMYGHRMKNESMFGALRSYEEEPFWQAHPNVYVVDAQFIRRYEVFAAYEVGVREIVYRLDIEKNSMEQEFIDFCLERTVINTGITPTAQERFLTLSTCTGQGHAKRWAVISVLREEIAR